MKNFLKEEVLSNSDAGWIERLDMEEDRRTWSVHHSCSSINKRVDWVTAVFIINTKASK